MGARKDRKKAKKARKTKKGSTSSAAEPKRSRNKTSKAGEQFCTLLNKRLGTLGITPVEMAELLDAPRAVVEKWTSGESLPTGDRSWRLLSEIADTPEVLDMWKEAASEDRRSRAEGEKGTVPVNAQGPNISALILDGVVGDPEFARVSLDKIQIDPRYQRGVNRAHIGYLKGSWCPIQPAIMLAKRPNGTLWAIDGQHRVVTAKELKDVDSLFALIVPVDGQVKTEARMFLLFNKTKHLTAMDKYKTELMAGYNDAVLVSKLVSSIGYEVKAGQGKNSIACIAYLRAWARKNPVILKRSLEMCKLLFDGDPINNIVFSALCNYEYYRISIGWDESLFSKRNVQKLLDHGHKQIQSRCTSMTEAIGSGNNSPRAQVKAMVQIINHGRKTKRIPDRD